MSFEEQDIKLVIDEWLAATHDDDLDKDEDSTVASELLEDEQLFDSVDDAKASGMLRLANYPLSEWKYIKISPKSNLCDLLWDFTDYPSVGNRAIKVNFNYASKFGLNLVDPQNDRLLKLTQALLFYRIPHVNPAGRVRSYSTLMSDAKKVQRVIAFCYEYQIFKEEIRLTINDISRFTIESHLNNLDSASKRWEFSYIMRFWQDLSRQGFLPVELSIYEELVTKEMVSEYRAQYDNESNP